MINWQELTVTVGDRSAIYLETFPLLLDEALTAAPDVDAARAECDPTMLLQVLATFAGAWGSLGRIGHHRRVVFIGLAQDDMANGVLRFVAREQRPDQVVVTDITLRLPA